METYHHQEALAFSGAPGHRAEAEVQILQRGRVIH